MKIGLVAVVALVSLGLAACQADHRPQPTAPARTPRPAAHLDLRTIPTATSKVDQVGADQAETVARVTLLSLPPPEGTAEDLLAPQRLSADSPIDVLRATAGQGAAAADERQELQTLRWAWMVFQDDLRTNGTEYQARRASITAFASAAGASAYAAKPFLLEPKLSQAASTALDAAPSGALLRRADEPIPRVNDPATDLPGERVSLIWQRGQLVLEVAIAASPATDSIPILLALAQQLDQQAQAIPGYDNS